MNVINYLLTVYMLAELKKRVCYLLVMFTDNKLATSHFNRLNRPSYSSLLEILLQTVIVYSADSRHDSQSEPSYQAPFRIAVMYCSNNRSI